mgnify:CR=1 FL=1
MTKVNYDAEIKIALDRLLLGVPEVTGGIVFGLPCYKIRGTVFATLYGDGVGIKLPADHVSTLLDKPGFGPFQPFGRNRGKEFVQITRDDPEDYQQDRALFEESIRYVLPASVNQSGNSQRVQVSTAEDAEQRFRSIAALLAAENKDIAPGKMMSSPAIKYRGKVFAFYYGNKMVFRLGRDFRPETFGINQYSILAPFKTKPPMMDWFEIPATSADKWETLARYALLQKGGSHRS